MITPVDSPPRVNRIVVRILAGLCIACGFFAASFGFMTGIMMAGLAGLMRDPSLGFLVFLLPAVAGLPFLILGFFLFRANSWARRALVVLLTLALVPFAGMLGNDFGLQDTPPLDFGIAFALGVAVLVFTIL